MSTKDIMKQHFEKDTGRSFQVYNEIFDDEGEVYLELEGFHFEAASSAALVTGKPRLVVQLSREWAQKIGLSGNDFEITTGSRLLLRMLCIGFLFNSARDSMFTARLQRFPQAAVGTAC